MEVSDPLEVVKRFESLMVSRLKEGDGPSDEERMQQILDVLDPDVVFHVTPAIPHGGEHIGHEGFLKLREAFTRAWILVSGGNHEYIDVGDGARAIVLTNPSVFKSRRTGTVVSFRMVELITVRNGKIVDFIPFYWDTVQIAEAAGGIEAARVGG
jgi:ketosteroid isomerase-like protein